MTMKLHHFTGASLCPVGARLVNGAGGLFARGRMVCHCWLVESRDGLILVDTGIGTADLEDLNGRMGRWFTWMMGPDCSREVTALGCIEALGFDPADVRHVIGLEAPRRRRLLLPWRDGIPTPMHHGVIAVPGGGGRRRCQPPS